VKTAISAGIAIDDLGRNREKPEEFPHNCATDDAAQIRATGMNEWIRKKLEGEETQQKDRIVTRCDESKRTN